MPNDPLSPVQLAQRARTISLMLLRMEPQIDQVDAGEQLGTHVGTMLRICLQPELAAAISEGIMDELSRLRVELFPLQLSHPPFLLSVAAALVGPAAQPPKES